MKNAFILLSLIIIYGCKSEKSAKKIDLADVNLIIDSDVKIDSVWFSNFNQTEFYFLPYKDTIKVDFKETLDDLYNVQFYTPNGVKSGQFWLDGNNVIISGTVNDNFEVDSVINSALYNKTVDFSEKYNRLINNKSDSLTVDDFLLEKISENVQNPFSFAISGIYIFRNQNDKMKIKELYNVLSVQSDTLKNHILSSHRRIENILSVNLLNTTEYKFTNINDELTSINMDNSKTYLLDFWFVNCPPCVKDHKLISNKLDFLKKQNVELIGISTDKKYGDWKNYLDKHSYDWKNLREIDSLKRITTDMGIWSFPTYLHLDSEGNILGRFGSFESFESFISGND